jgi:hypothetical protein
MTLPPIRGHCRVPPEATAALAAPQGPSAWVVLVVSVVTVRPPERRSAPAAPVVMVVPVGAAV